MSAEVAALVRARAERAERNGETDHAHFLRCLASTIAVGAYNVDVQQRFAMVRTTEGVTVRCSNDTQIGWVEDICRNAQVNFLTPKVRVYERQLFIR